VEEDEEGKEKYRGGIRKEKKLFEQSLKWNRNLTDEREKRKSNVNSQWQQVAEMREGNGMLVTADGGDFNVKKQLLCIMFF
jgi:hypothetical protein